jgi:hypothetical protein
VRVRLIVVVRRLRVRMALIVRMVRLIVIVRMVRLIVVVRGVRVRMTLIVRMVRLIVVVRVVRVRMTLIVRAVRLIVVVRGVRVRMTGALLEPELRRRHARPEHAVGAQLVVADPQAAERTAELVERESRVQTGPEDHVARRAVEAVEIEDPHVTGRPAGGHRNSDLTLGPAAGPPRADRRFRSPGVVRAAAYLKICRSG